MGSEHIGNKCPPLCEYYFIFCSYCWCCSNCHKFGYRINSSLYGESNTLFIIHGHDEINTLKLKYLLKERWNLDPLLLTERPGKGRTIIEKFEEEARKARFVFAILTPDDLIKGSFDEYRQSRPNVFFELGWFYGQIGRENVCILFKEGTKIHSDLEGISRIKFNEGIVDKFIEIERELKEAHIIQ